MKFKIGFSAEPETPAVPAPKRGVGRSADPVRSLVRVHFPARSMTLSYYNDTCDLRRGDLVFVDGKLAGIPGRVVEVCYNFKIKLSDYKRVLSFADTDVYGTFPAAGLNASAEVIHRGEDYYRESRVSYISLDGYRGRAIVEGSRPYDVEFEYADGEILNMVCPCFCAFPCKHEVAVLLQLRETLELIEKHYAADLAQTGCFAAVSRDTLFSYALGARGDLTLTLG